MSETESNEQQLEAFRAELRRVVDLFPKGGVVRVDIDRLGHHDSEMWNEFKQVYNKIDRQVLLNREGVSAALKEIEDFGRRATNDMKSGAMNESFADWLRNKLGAVIQNLSYILDENCEVNSVDEVYEEFSADRTELFG